MTRKYARRFEWCEPRRCLSASPITLVEHTIQCCAGDAISDFYLADIDGDLDIDAASRAYDGRNNVTLGWFPNNEGGEFGNQHLLRNDRDHRIPVDLNGDGIVDLLGEETWRPNLGGGHFGPLKIISEKSRPLPQPADVDGDADLDIVYWHRDHIYAEWHENLDGLGNFAPVTSRFISNLPDAPKWMADWDQDGDFDILEQTSTNIDWYENRGDLQFSAPIPLLDERVLFDNSFEVVDLNQDGHNDLLFSRDREIHWAQNDGTDNLTVKVLFGLSEEFPEATYYVDLFLPRTADLDGDGDLDIAVAMDSTNSEFSQLARGGFRWYENQGPASGFVARGAKPVVEPRIVYAHDVDLDGDQDVIVGDFSILHWYENTNSRGEFAAGKPIPGSPPSPVINLMPPVDLNQDGFDDLVFVVDSTLRWQPYSEAAKGFGQSAAIAPFRGGDTFAATVDVDIDGAIDLILLRSDNEWSWLRNEGVGLFGEERILAREFNEVLLGFADVDGDGFLDLFSGKNQDLRWRKNLPGETFSDPLPLATRPDEIQFPLSYSSGRFTNRTPSVRIDLDGDGDLDVVSSYEPYTYYLNWLPGRLVWRENVAGQLGDAHTVNRQSSATLVVADVDGDKDPDIVSLSRISNTLSWFESQIFGDSNDDGRFDSQDLVSVFQAGTYNQLLSARTTFDEGDWNGDGIFDDEDLVAAFQIGHYQR